MNNILLVCVGNICRSPMAEGLFRQALPEKQVFSAGLDAMVGHAADPHAVSLMAARGVDIREHRARRIEGWMMQESDLILTMEEAHKDYLESRYPAAQGKVALLSQALRCDIPDPYRQDRRTFEHVCELIEQSLEMWLASLKPAARQGVAARPAGGRSRSAST